MQMLTYGPHLEVEFLGLHITCVRPQVLQQRALQPAAVGTVGTAEGFLATVDAHMTPQRQFGGELPVEQRAHVSTCSVIGGFWRFSRGIVGRVSPVTEGATESQILVLVCFLPFSSLPLPVLHDALRQTDLISAWRTRS